MGTLIMKFNDHMNCADYSTSQSSSTSKSKNRLLFIKNKHSHDKDIVQLIEGLKRNGIEVVEVDYDI